jgi:hypothetical protein
MRAKIILIAGLLWCPCSSVSAADDANKYQLLPNASMKELHAGGRSVASVMPIFGQVVAFTLPNGFQPVFENTQGAGYTFEAVPQGETVRQWSQMVTVTGAKELAANNPNVSPQLFLAKFAALFKASCPDTFAAKEIGATKISGYDAFTALIGCGTTRFGGNEHSETALVVAVKGSQDYYTFQWAERGPARSQPIDLGDAKWQDRLKKLTPIKICARVPGEAAPYPSCVEQK